MYIKNYIHIYICIYHSHSFISFIHPFLHSFNSTQLMSKSVSIQSLIHSCMHPSTDRSTHMCVLFLHVNCSMTLKPISWLQHRGFRSIEKVDGLVLDMTTYRGTSIWFRDIVNSNTWLQSIWFETRARHDILHTSTHSG